MKKIISLILLILILAVIGISGCTDTAPIQNKTFNKNGINFQYPGNWSDNATITFTQNTSNVIEEIGTLGNGNVTLAVLYLNMTKYPQYAQFDIGTLKDLAISSWKSDGTNTSILSNINSPIGNRTAYEVIYTAPDPVNNVLFKNYYVMMGDKGKEVYILRFNAPEADFAKYYDQFKSIESSVQIQ